MLTRIQQLEQLTTATIDQSFAMLDEHQAVIEAILSIGPAAALDLAGPVRFNAALLFLCGFTGIMRGYREINDQLQHRTRGLDG